MTDPLAFDEVILALARRALAPPPAAVPAGTRLELVEALAGLLEAQTRGAPAACLAPLVPGATFGGGARVPGSSLELEPAQAAYCIAWLSGSARVGALLPLGDWLARRAVLAGERPARVLGLLEGMMLARRLARSLRLPAPVATLPLAAPLSMRVALAAVAARWLGADLDGVAGAVSLAFAEGLQPHDGELARACAAAASTGVRVALLAHGGATPVPRVLSTRPAGFEAALLGGEHISLAAEAEVDAAVARAGAPEELATWHRFELAVRERFPVRRADKVLATVNATVAVEALPLQGFVAALVRAG